MPAERGTGPEGSDTQDNRRHVPLVEPLSRMCQRLPLYSKMQWFLQATRGALPEFSAAGASAVGARGVVVDLHDAWGDWTARATAECWPPSAWGCGLLAAHARAGVGTSAGAIAGACAHNITMDRHRPGGAGAGDRAPGAAAAPGAQCLAIGSAGGGTRAGAGGLCGAQACRIGTATEPTAGPGLR